MTSQRFSIFLMLIMLVTPVISVFSYYSTVVNQLPAKSVNHVAASLTDDAAAYSDLCPQHNKSKLSCDANSQCSFSICGYGNITVALLLLTIAYSVHRYRQINKIFLRSLVIPPEIKPPIHCF